MASRKLILAGEVLTPGQAIPNGYLLIEDEQVVEVGRQAEWVPEDCEVFDASSYRVTPGLIDLHVHGAMGHCAMGPGLADVAQALARHGVTSFLPTTLTAAPQTLCAALEAMAAGLQQPAGGARPLGIHLEGPHLSPQRAGMADARLFCPLTPEAWEGLQASAQGTIRMVTFAPEEGDGMDLIPRLLREGVVPSIGHSDATFEQVGRMVELGLKHASHVFNAMRPFHHRAPGVVGAVLYHEQIVAQLIADLHHVHPAAIELVLRLKGAERVALVSDAAPPAGLPPGEYTWGGQTRLILGDDGTCRTPDGTLAGAASFLDQHVHNLAQTAGLLWPEALLTATSVPGEVLSVRRGRLRPGWIADVVVWDDRFEPVATMVEGRWVWRRDVAEWV
ncbi:MAG: N-acetylglucosamine-6-phosphate deacetylase [Anaerolineae bacterium]